jgi:MFS family permease
VRSYRALLSDPAARWPLLTSTLFRVTPGMMVLALVLLLREGGYAYTVAGLVTAAHQVGVAVGSPVQGRLVDRFGQPVVLIPDAVLFLAGTLAIAAAVSAAWAVPPLLGLALVTGMVLPPTTACSRVVLSTLFPSGRLRETAFALSSIAVELGFIVGPLVAVAVATSVGASWSVVLAGVFGAAGASAFAATSASRTAPRRERTTPRTSALRAPGVRVMVVALGGLAVAFGVLDIVVPAVAELVGTPAAAGPLIAAVASGSLLGGLVYGGRSWPGTVVTRLRVLITVFTGGLLLVPWSVGSLRTFAVALFLAGLFLAPVTICAFQLIDDLALPGTQTEAQSWTQSSVVAGVALGASLSGIAVDAGGPSTAFLAGAVCVGLAAVLVNLRHGRLRDTRRGTTTSAPAVA